MTGGTRASKPQGNFSKRSDERAGSVTSRYAITSDTAYIAESVPYFK